MLSDDFESSAAGEDWKDKTEHRFWKVRYAGFGQIGTTKDGSTVLFQKAKASRSPDETHAALVTTKEQFTDFELRVRMKTKDQLREPKPNPWESAWVVWRYTDDHHFYYFALQTNGWGLGKADPAYDGQQRFLDDSRKDDLTMDEWHDVRVRHVDNKIRVWVDGDALVDFTDEEKTYEKGHIGLYSEDSEVVFDDVEVSSLSD